jgi:hypothetical protein
LSAHFFDGLGRRFGGFELNQLANSNSGHRIVPELMQRIFDGLTSGVKKSRFESDINAHASHASFWLICDEKVPSNVAFKRTEIRDSKSSLVLAHRSGLALHAALAMILWSALDEHGFLGFRHDAYKVPDFMPTFATQVW